MKIITILGTRPEIIRLSRVVPLLDQILGRENHYVVNTGQNSDASLNGNFFTELGLRDPGYCMGQVAGTFADQIAALFPRTENVLSSFKPDRVLVLGDTNSSLAAIVCARLNIPVYHMEAGNRSFSLNSPEEVNRRLVDHCSAVHLPYTERSRQNLLAEGIHSSRIFVTGNPIHEVINHYREQWTQSDVLRRLEVEAGRFFLVTLHRAENIDNSARLDRFIQALAMLNHQCRLPVIVSTHPHLRTRLEESGRLAGSPLRFLSPFSFFDFLRLQSSAFCVLTDSGTVQEEACILKTPCVVLRDYTERPETVECGASVLSGADPTRILALVKQVTSHSPIWTTPSEYLRNNVAETVCGIVTSHYERPTL